MNESHIYGFLKAEEMDALAQDIGVQMDGKDRLRYLEIGTCEGRSAIGMARRLGELGFDVQMDTVDAYQVCIGFPAPHKMPCFEQALRNIELFRMGDHIRAHKVRLRSRLRDVLPGPYDVVFIDGEHSYACVLADLFEATRLVAEDGVIYGDDYSQGAPHDGIHKVLEDLSADVKFITDKKIWRLCLPTPRDLFRVP